MAGEGVLQWIDDTELESWGFAAAARAAVGAAAAGDPALQRFKEGGSAASQPAIFQVNALWQPHASSAHHLLYRASAISMQQQS